MSLDDTKLLLLLMLGLPWLALAVLQLPGPWARGAAPGRWLWLVPAAITGGVLALAASGAGTAQIDLTLLAWLPELGIRVGLLVDGLSLFFGLVVAGMGALIFVYTAAYFSDKPQELRRFYSYLLLFLAAMLGTVFSANLLMLYVWWELTGIASFFLIGYLHEDDDARRGARMALLTTVSAGMCLLAGILLVGGSAGTFDILELVARAPDHVSSPAWTVGFLLMLVGAFGKSAQIPFHYWLPNAMAAPTPVSAYLHSATMVKLGVFLIARIFPIFRELDAWVPVLVLVGFTTFLLGATFALLSHKLKAILAFSTVSQLGFLVGFYGISPPEGSHWDLLHIANHVLYKGALFMAVGVIDHATGIKDLRQLGGLRKRLPLTFWITLLSAASMAGVIFTSGFLSKEYMLKEKLDYLNDGLFLNYFPIALVVLGSVFKVAFSLRLVWHVFLGAEPAGLERRFHAPSLLLQLPPLLLTALTMAFGLLPALLDRALRAFAVPGLHAPDPPPLKLWHGLDSPAFHISLAILLLGYLLYRVAVRRGWDQAEIPRWLRLDLAFDLAIERLPALGARVTRWLGVERPGVHVLVVLAVALLWVGRALLAEPASGWLPPAPEGDLLLTSLAALLLLSAGVALLLVRAWKTQVVLVGAIGFLVTFYFVLYRAPDLALTQILVEAASLLLMLILVLRFPQLRCRPPRLPRLRRGLSALIAIGVGLLMGGLTLLFATGGPTQRLGQAYLEASLPRAKGTNAVNTILVDFRGFDTMLEIGVLVIALLGVAGLLARRARGGERA